MTPKISVITPFSRGLKELTQLLRDFKNQTLPKQLFEHVIVRDGPIPDDVAVFMERHKNDYNIKFTHIDKDPGDMRIAPGTRPRNHGVSIATGSYVCFMDDDDRIFDKYLEKLMSETHDNAISIVQMSCQESRIYKNGDPNRIILVPEAGLPTFPIICHVGTPCFCVPRAWALAEPWRHEPEHDYRFIKRICDKYHPEVHFIGGMAVDVDGLVIGQMRDWVSIPPFYRPD